MSVLQKVKGIFYISHYINLFNRCIVFLKPLFHLLLDVFFPQCCCLCCCKIDQGWLCDKCNQSCFKIDQRNCCKSCGYPLQINESSVDNFLDKKKIFCPSCNSALRYFNLARSCYQYKTCIRQMLKSLKFYFQTNVLPFISDQMFEVYKTMPEADYICFIPITRRKLFVNGYNHSGLIAVSFLKKFQKIEYNNIYDLKKTKSKIILLEDLLLKTHNTKSSKELSQEQRWLKKYNFEINKKYQTEEWKRKMQGKTILIIDDIMTTGATLNTASYVLKQTFPNIFVECITFARTMLY